MRLRRKQTHDFIDRMSRPTQLRAGSKYEWTETVTLEAGESLKARLLQPTAAPLAYTVVTAVDVHTITIPATLLASLTPGKYEQVIYAEKGSGASAEQRIIADEYIELLPNIAGASVTLTKSYARQLVESLEKSYLTLTGQIAVQASAHQRSILYRDLADVEERLNAARIQLANEEAALNGNRGNSTMIKMYHQPTSW